MKKIFTVICLFISAGAFAQTVREDAIGHRVNRLPLTKISILSSGLAYFEHSGTITGAAVIELPFKENAVNDALKSLVINDSASQNPSVSYQGEQALFQILRSLKIDLSDNPDTAAILSRLRGTEIVITAPDPASGRIIGVEYRPRILPTGMMQNETWLSLHTDKGIQLFNFSDINSINFKDPQLRGDLSRALDILTSSRNLETRNLIINLPGSTNRNVTISYVIPAPVWKVSYRLDLGSGSTKPLLQGWAIVDNDSDIDWNNVRLSLLAGRPASFIQNLYPPYYVWRPVLPLAIAGTASAQTHDTGFGMRSRVAVAEEAVSEDALIADRALNQRFDMEMAAPPASLRANVTGGAVETTSAAATGDQFEFTMKNPISLDRRMSAMLPLAESNVDAKKLLIFSGSNTGRNQNPRVGAELTNTSGMKLPAGPITVYDGGSYAGDALIEFWNEGEKRLISFGEDLSVTGAVMDTSSRTMSGVIVSGGIMTLNRTQEFLKTYTFKNNSAEEKNLVIEHLKTSNTKLESPNADEETPSLYRFSTELPGNKEFDFQVRETRVLTERITLLQLRPETFLSYISSDEIPANVKTALQKAVELRAAVTAAENEVREAERQRSAHVSEQDRIRKNLEAAGNQTEQGQEYLNRLLSIDAEIDKLAPELEKLRENTRAAQKAYEDYLSQLNL